MSMMQVTTKFMNTTIWLREARDRLLGGGVPGSGRNASLADFGTMVPVVAGRCPNSPLLGGLLFMTRYRSIVQRIPPGTVEANMAKLAWRGSLASAVSHCNAGTRATRWC